MSGISRALLTLLVNTPDVSLQLDQSAKKQIFFGVTAELGEQIKDSGVTHLYLFPDRGGRVIANSWNDTSGPGVCHRAPAAFVIMNITEGERERDDEGKEECKRGVCGKYQQLR